MKTIPIEIVEHRRSTVTETEADRITIERIRHHCGLQGATHIDEKGNLCREEEIRAGGHSSWETKILRAATPLDHAALALVHRILRNSSQAPGNAPACANHSVDAPRLAGDFFASPNARTERVLNTASENGDGVPAGTFGSPPVDG